jgi:hypothetical protein
LGKVLEEAWKLGCKFDSWTEHFKFEKWLNAFENCGLEASYFANRKFEFEEILPWDHISSGVSKEWLKKECLLAFHEKRTEDCRIVPCSGCGVCPQLDVKPEVMEKM